MDDDNPPDCPSYGFVVGLLPYGAIRWSRANLDTSEPDNKWTRGYQGGEANALPGMPEPKNGDVVSLYWHNGKAFYGGVQL